MKSGDEKERSMLLPCNRLEKDSRKGRKQGEKFHLAVSRSGVFESADEL